MRKAVFEGRAEPPDPQSVVLEHISELRLESAAAAITRFGFILDKDRVEAVAVVFESKADSSRSRGDIRRAVRLERRARAIRVFYEHGLTPERLIPPVDFQDGYRGKILLISISGGAAGGIACLRSGDLWHDAILKNAEEEIEDLGFENAVVEPAGGASVRFDEQGGIQIYGTSDSFGECDKTVASDLIGRSFPGKKVAVE